MAEVTPEALAAELERGAADLDALSRKPESLADKPHWNRIRGRVASLRYSANRVRELTPALAALAAERDAHKLRADHYEGLWRAEHGLPPDGTTLEADSCQLPCDPDCESGPVHCWNVHRPSHKPDWHDPATCPAIAREALEGGHG